MGQAAYIKKVKISTDQTTWHDLPATSPSLDFPSSVHEDTDLANNDGFKSRVIGLHDWSIGCDSNYKTGDTALQMVRDAKLNRTKLYAQYLPGGTVAAGGGYQGEVVVENYNLSGDVDGLETVGITLQANGALADAS